MDLAQAGIGKGITSHIGSRIKKLVTTCSKTCNMRCYCIKNVPKPLTSVH